MREFHNNYGGFEVSLLFVVVDERKCLPAWLGELVLLHAKLLIAWYGNFACYLPAILFALGVVHKYRYFFREDIRSFGGGGEGGWALFVSSL